MLQDVAATCKSVSLTLNKPMFPENTMPQKWMSILRTNIHEFTIMNGNLMYVSSDAFMSQYSASIRVLEFKNLELRTWTSNSLVGLSSLKQLYISNTTIHNVPRNALQSVRDTLRSLTITRSNHWDPTNVTGSSSFAELRIVDFSSNSFKDVLGKNSFTGLQKCRDLYLNSCEITYIGAGAFDNLQSIQMIYLHNNQLHTIPVGLFTFKVIAHHKPRINLQDNLWHCRCSENEIRQLTNRDMLLTDPYCHSPENFKNKTFSDLETMCTLKENYNYSRILETNTQDEKWDLWDELEDDDDICGIVYLSNNCHNGDTATTNSPLRMFSPVYGHKCPKNDVILPDLVKNPINEVIPTKNWIKLTYFLKTHNYSMVEIGALEPNDYGLLWYQTTCPNEVYCISDVPSVFRIYNRDVNAEYIFCPILLNTGQVDGNNCVLYNNNTFDYKEAYKKLHILLYVGAGTVCVVFGALCVYAIIRQNPYLLKGSKRILFVKHKSVDVLVMPPKVPLRNDWVNPESTPHFDKKKIFIMPSNLNSNRFNRTISRRSSKSSAPSYISALQPTEDQLAEWRIRHHFNNDVPLTSNTSELSAYSWVSSDDSIYHSIDNYRIYESLK